MRKPGIVHVAAAGSETGHRSLAGLRRRTIDPLPPHVQQAVDGFSPL
jgi:hypothetical protein